eukprot:11213269-Ditylum_brightwellii.AAC.1
MSYQKVEVEGGLAPTKKQDQGIVSSLNETKTKANDTTKSENNTEVMPNSQSLDLSFCFVSPLDLKNQIANNMLCMGCVEKDSVETKEGICIIVLPEYHQQMNTFLNINQPSFKYDAT